MCLSGVEDEDQSGSEECFGITIKAICPPPSGNIVWSCYLLVASSVGYKFDHCTIEAVFNATCLVPEIVDLQRI